MNTLTMLATAAAALGTLLTIAGTIQTVRIVRDAPTRVKFSELMTRERIARRAEAARQAEEESAPRLPLGGAA